jgi:AGZA family xanthine/uracil permease-like MFS transporter
MLSRIDRYFEISARGSTIGTEVLAGLSTFLALSYIFIVNPAILAQAGMNKSATLFATIIASGIGTILMGTWARLPFVLAPGMEMNAYVAFFAVGALGLSWQQALGTVFWSGVLFFALTITKIRQGIIDAVPDAMKSGLSLSVGIGDPRTRVAGAFLFSVILTILLDRLRIRAAVLLGIVATTIFCYTIGVPHLESPAAINRATFGATAALNIALPPRLLSVVLVLFLVDFYGSVAKLIGLSSSTSIPIDRESPGMQRALVIDSSSTIAGSLLGTTNLTVFVESGVGISAGGRTGLTAVVAGTFMLSCFAIAPLLSHIPLIAASGALVLVAIKLYPRMSQLRDSSSTDIAANALMQVAVIATFAIDRAMLVGFATHILASLLQRRRPNPYLVASTCALLAGAVLQAV